MRSNLAESATCIRCREDRLRCPASFLFVCSSPACNARIVPRTLPCFRPLDTAFCTSHSVKPRFHFPAGILNFHCCRQLLIAFFMPRHRNYDQSKNERRRASSRRGESRKSSRRDRVSRAVESGSDTDSNTEERNGNPSSSSRLHKRSGKRSNGRRSTRKQKSAGGKESEDDKRKTARKSSSSSPSSSSSDSDLDSNDDRGAPKVSESRSMPPRHAGITCEGSQAADGVVPGDTPIDRARVPLQRLRNLIEEKLRSKARESKAKLGNEEKEVVADIDSG